jgi:hypothetical protein
MRRFYEVLLEMGSAAMIYSTYYKGWFMDSKGERGGMNRHTDSR